MARNKYFIPFVVILVIAVILVFIVIFQVVSDLEQEERAILDVQIYDWAENMYNSEEMFFDYWIYNYGNVEAKNIKVRCDLWNEDGTEILSTVVDNYGNLASLSAEFGEVVTEDVANDYDLYIPLCYVQSCDNCEILYKRISDLVESYDG